MDEVERKCQEQLRMNGLGPPVWREASATFSDSVRDLGVSGMRVYYLPSAGGATSSTGRALHLPGPP